MTTNTITSQITKQSLTGCAASLALFATLTTGCSQDTHCSELGDCGGPTPVGQWELAPGHGSCSEDLYEPLTDPRLLGGEIPPARTQTIEPALYDWCDQFVAGYGNGIKLESPVFFYESAPIGRAFVKYTPDDPAKPEKGGTFSAGLTRTGTYTLDFPAVCMREFGATDNQPEDPTISPPDLKPVDICTQLQVQVKKDGIGAGAYFNVVCEKNDGVKPVGSKTLSATKAAAQRAGIPVDPGGCVCTYDLTSTGGPAGRYTMLSDGHTIVHLLSNAFPVEATYCNKGTSLELTGANGSYLFGVKGLRTLDLAKTAATP